MRAMLRPRRPTAGRFRPRRPCMRRLLTLPCDRDNAHRWRSRERFPSNPPHLRNPPCLGHGWGHCPGGDEGRSAAVARLGRVRLRSVGVIHHVEGDPVGARAAHRPQRLARLAQSVLVAAEDPHVGRGRSRVRSLVRSLRIAHRVLVSSRPGETASIMLPGMKRAATWDDDVVRTQRRTVKQSSDSAVGPAWTTL